jgi:hypothetical protein
LNRQLLNFRVKDSDISIKSLPTSFDHLVRTLLYRKETLEFENSTKTFLSHETRRKPVNCQADCDTQQNNKKIYIAKLGKN